MKLERAVALLRPRGPWEAMDMGIALARIHYIPFLLGWLSVAVPLWLVLTLCLHTSPGWLSIALWWTKPLLTRQPIFFLSRSLFGDMPHWSALWTTNRDFLTRGLLADLSYRRFFTDRSFVLSVTLLEKLRGKQRAARAAVLSGHGGRSASYLTLVVIHFEQVIALGFLWFCGDFTPGDWMREAIAASIDGTGIFPDLPPLYQWLAAGTYAAAITLMEPFYAAAGFGLYINSRTHLEGWDIELAFRRMTERLKNPPTKVMSVIIVLFLCLPHLVSGAVLDDSIDSKAIRATIEEIKSDPAFEVEKRMLKVPTALADASDSSTAFDGFSFSDWAGQILGWTIIACALAALIVILVKNRNVLLQKHGLPPPINSPPSVVMGLAITPTSLPDDLTGAARNAWEAGHVVAAMRLLYRGSITWMVTCGGVTVLPSDTEGDCLRHAGNLSNMGHREYFSTLTKTWLACAYADQTPAAAEMENLIQNYPFPQPTNRNKAYAPTSTPVLLIVAMIIPLIAGCKKVTYTEEEKIIGFNNEARFKPWLAAERFLARNVIEMEIRVASPEMLDKSTLLLIPLSRLMSDGGSMPFEQWILQGGHGVVMLTETEEASNDYQDHSPPLPSEGAPLLKRFSIKPISLTTDCHDELTIGSNSLTLVNNAQIGIDVRGLRNADIIAGKKSQASLASVQHGLGRLTFMASARPWRNRWISESDHAALLLALVKLEHSIRVLMIPENPSTLWQMLIRHAWMPLVAGLLLTALWLWKAWPRFGPIQSEENRQTHAGTLIDDTGAFLYKHAGPIVLIEPARRAVLAAAATRGLVPTLHDFHAQIAIRTGFDENRIRSLLDRQDFNSSEEFIALCADLQTLQFRFGIAT